MRKKYSITGIDCAHCAAKLEAKMNELPQVNEAVLSFTTSQLYIEAEDPDAVLPLIRELAEREEPGTKIEAEHKCHDEKEHKKKHTHDHTHEHGTVCACGNHEHGGEHEKGWKKSRECIMLLVGALFFAAAVFIEYAAGKIAVPYLPEALFVIAYIILGAEIILTAVRNLFRGKVFDENFLMSLATIGAFFIGDFAEAVGVMLFYRIGELFEDLAVDKSRRQIMDAVDMRPEIVRLYEDGKITERAPEEIKIGDCIEIRPGDRIPLDGIVIRGESRIDTSAVTGEPVPIAVKEQSRVLSGCVNTSGTLYLRVEKLLEDSMVTRILEAVENAAASKPKMDRFITKFARIYTPFVVVLAMGTAIIPSMLDGNWSGWIYTALSFLIISCPCALVLSVPLAFFAGIGAGSKRGILFKGGMSLEMLADVRAVVMDKTGTITEGSFAVESIDAVEGYTQEQILAWAAGAEHSSSHPIAASILQAARERGVDLLQPEEVTEISGEGMAVVLDHKKMICGNRKLFAHYQIKLPAGVTDGGGTEVLLAVDGKYAGRIWINDKIKSDSKEAIQAMAKKGLYTVMLTGDTLQNAENVQKAVGIDTVFAHQMPEDKLRNLQKVREEHGAVMFIGDGINDAPVLAGADVGAAMGSGSDAAIEAADVVFMTSRLTALVESYGIAKATARIAKQNVVFALAVKAAVMLLGLCGIASMWMAVFADSGVAMLCVMNSIRVLYRKKI